MLKSFSNIFKNVDTSKLSLDLTTIYDDITNTVLDKKEYYFTHNPFADKNNKWNKKVYCIHCGKVHNFNEYKIIKDKETGTEYIVCPDYPKCDGLLTDFILKEEINK